MPLDERTRDVNGFYVDNTIAAVDKSVEEDALDTMLETSVVELDEALGGIVNYVPTTTDHPGQAITRLEPQSANHANSPFNLPESSTGMIPTGASCQQQPEPQKQIEISPPKIALLARDKVFQSALAPPPPRRTKARSWNNKDRAGQQQSAPATAVNKNNDPKGTEPEIRNGRWTLDEKVLFLYGLQKYGQGKWKQIQQYCRSRSLIQIKSHGQKVLKRLKQGDNVFGKMEEHCARLHYLVTKIHTGNNTVRPPEPPAPKNPEHILVASALCQLGDNAQSPQPLSAALTRGLTGSDGAQHAPFKSRNGS